ncbi:hypothetical protein [Microbispora sp. H10949]|uniref:hypothetical protein n=1 Tax=Microbispora sp. H10949 TaxID=2729111 RepID=UPI001600788E|nr:hypothetical protein [Microbispora sp. H10949]
MGIDREAWADRLFGPREDLRDGVLDDVPDEPLDVVVSLTELLGAAGELVGRYSTPQLADGLWYLAADSGLFRQLYNPAVPEDPRAECAAAIRELHKRLFEPLCENALSHGDHGAAVEERLNSICYMWWDVFPTWGSPDDSAAHGVDEVLLDVMRGTLSSENVACVESGLHGLGHWHTSYPDLVESTIDAFLRERPEIGVALRDYAHAARRGRVL